VESHKRDSTLGGGNAKEFTKRKTIIKDKVWFIMFNVIIIF